MRTLLVLIFLTTSAYAKPLVIASFSILGDMVRHIAGDRVEVESLVKPNQDSHVYEPSPQNAKDLSHASLVVVNGLGFEGWLDRLIKASGFHGKQLIVSHGISPLTYTIQGKESPDPHAWHSLENAQIYIDNIVKGLSELLPSEAKFFETRGDAYKKSLQTLEKTVMKELEEIPLEKRKVITSHNAFAYLGAEYGIQFYAPQGISTESEPSAKAVANLISLIKKENIKAIFIENISNPRLMEQVAGEAGVEIRGTLYSDALSSQGTQADTYLKMMSFNLHQLIEAMKEK